MIEKIKRFFKKIYEVLFKITNYDLLTPESVCHYIFSTESLPKPLKAEEENNLVYDFLNNNDLSAKSSLIEHNLRLVLYIAKKFEGNKLDLQELVSVGSIGLIKAVDSFSPDKNIKLATYASRCIENEILMYIRKINKTINDVSLDEPLSNEEDGDSLTLGEVIADTNIVYDEVELKDQKEYLLQVIEQLNSREKTIMYMRYGLNGYDELTQKEVADEMKISQSYISRLEKKILHKLKSNMNKN